MKFKQFRETAAFKQHGQWYILTINEQCADYRVAVAQWEPSNGKWYMPQPYEGRVEFGYLDTFGQHGKIEHIRPVFSNPSRD